MSQKKIPCAGCPLAVPSPIDSFDEDLSLYDWQLHARESQKVPPGDWRTWLILAGRGFGKTRTGAETIRQWVTSGTCRRIALVGDSEYDVREVMIHGESGLLNIHPSAERPTFYPSKRKLIWPSGATAMVYTAQAYERLRGPQFDGAWVDELAKFRKAQQVWDQLMFCLRLGVSPRVIVTTTPRPMALLERLMKVDSTFITRGSTYENADNLAPAYVDQIIQQYEGTKMGAQEILGHVIFDQNSPLWRNKFILYEKDQEFC